MQTFETPGPLVEPPRAEPVRRLPEPPAAERILVIRLGALGDVVRTRYAFAGLRALYPRAVIDWLVEDRAAGGLEGITGLDEVIAVPRRALAWTRPARSCSDLSSLIRRLRGRGYDLAVDFHSILKSALLACASTRNRVGYAAPMAREGSWRLYTERVRYEPAHTSRFERNAALVRFLGGEVPQIPPPLELPEAVTRELDGVPSGLCVVHPGTSDDTLYKRWDVEGYAAVIRALHRAGEGQALVTWGPVPGERECAERVAERAGGAAVLAPRTPSVLHMLGVLRRSRLFIGSDSGPMHLASLAGLPVVGLFGPTDPIENAPFPGLPSRIVRRDVGCNPCREGCPARVCMAALSVEAVVGAARALVAVPRGVE